MIEALGTCIKMFKVVEKCTQGPNQTCHPLTASTSDLELVSADDLRCQRSADGVCVMCKFSKSSPPILTLLLFLLIIFSFFFFIVFIVFIFFFFFFFIFFFIFSFFFLFFFLFFFFFFFLLFCSCYCYYFYSLLLLFRHAMPATGGDLPFLEDWDLNSHSPRNWIAHWCKVATHFGFNGAQDFQFAPTATTDAP